MTLFDTGPDSLSLARNADAMNIPVERIDRVVTSHWHSDHSGGLLSFLRLRSARSINVPPSCVVDVHPDRPIARGIAPGPGYDSVICALPPDPTFAAIEEASGRVEAHAEGHCIAADTVYVSGEIPRVTEYEVGILGGMRWVEDAGKPEQKGKWIKDGVRYCLPFSSQKQLLIRPLEKLITDERYVAIDVMGKGLVIFSA